MRIRTLALAFGLCCAWAACFGGDGDGSSDGTGASGSGGVGASGGSGGGGGATGAGSGGSGGSDTNKLCEAAKPCDVCIAENAGTALEACFGADWLACDYSGAVCESYVSCLEACSGPEDCDCLSGCFADASMECQTCVMTQASDAWSGACATACEADACAMMTTSGGA